MIKYRRGYDIDYIRLMEMLAQEGREEEKIQDYKYLVDMVEGSLSVITAWDFDYMIGFANLAGDKALDSRVENVVVDMEYRELGIDKELQDRILVHHSA